MNQPYEELPGTQLVELWQQNDERAATELYRRFMQRILRVANQQMSSRLQARVDEDDVLQSVFRTFFKRAQAIEDGERFHFSDDEDLWKVLVTITLNKARGLAHKHQAQKRDHRAENSLDAHAFQAEYASQLVKQVNPIDAVVLTDLLEGLTCSLKPQLAEILRLRLENYSQEEIATELNISDRTVRRGLTQIREKLAWMDEQDSHHEGSS